MQFNWRYFLAGFVAVCSLTACEEEFDANADYEETAIIYALLDSSRPVQYVKVTKAFLNTKTSALYIAANEPDSTHFYHPITVELQKLSNDSTVLATYQMHVEQVLDKEEGNFSTANQQVYATDSNQVVLDGNDLFKVVVTNNVTGKQYTSSTRVVNSVCIKQVGYDPVQVCDPNGPSQALVPYAYQNLRFNLEPNAQIYKATYYLIYKEFKNGAEDIDTVEFSPINNRIITTGVSHVEEIKPFAMYDQMARSIDISSDDAGTYRTIEPCVVKVTAGGHELARYVQVNNAYSAITQSRPEYSNIRNGAGLFSSRNTQYVRAHFTQKAYDSLRIKYPDLKFAN